MNGICVLITEEAVVWYGRKSNPQGDAVLAGVLLIPFIYTLRFLLLRRGHDGLEWQGAQSALGADPSGHVVDVMFLVLLLFGGTVWSHCKRKLTIRSFFKVIGLLAVEITLVISLQAGNNMLFDPFFPKTRILNLPPELQCM